MHTVKDHSRQHPISLQLPWQPLLARDMLEGQVEAVGALGSVKDVCWRGLACSICPLVIRDCEVSGALKNRTVCSGEVESVGGDT